MVGNMTGYGRAEETVNGCTITVELRSVNNHYLDCNVRIPRLYLFAEESIKSRVQNFVSREGGRVRHPGRRRGRGGAVSVNRPLAQQYASAACRNWRSCAGRPPTASHRRRSPAFRRS